MLSLQRIRQILVQAPGVFPKTLRNMWAITAVLNPTLSLLSVGILPLDFINANPNAVMAEMGYRASGNGKWYAAALGARLTYRCSTA
jgi:hypothetical protein